MTALSDAPAGAVPTDPAEVHAWIMARAEEIKGWGESAPRAGRDPVNQPMIHNWVEAIGDDNPVYRDTDEARRLHGGPVAPTAMAQVWTMGGLNPVRDPKDPLHSMMQALDRAGFSSVLGTNCDQTYARNLRPGESVEVTTVLDSVVGPKTTGVGEGYFVTTRSIWRVGGEEVATMLFRVLKFKPGKRKPSKAELLARTIRPMRNRDTDFFWEGTAAGELRIQKCDACGALRHPPGPMCPSCHATSRAYVVASGRGTVFSFVEHHAPAVPGKELPLLLALVDLEEGVRMVGELHGSTAAEAAIGMPVEVVFDRVDDELTLPSWRPASSQGETR